MAIEAGVHVITELRGAKMQALHKAVVADVLFLNEIGLDPGIDHLSAKAVLDEWLKLEGKWWNSNRTAAGSLRRNRTTIRGITNSAGTRAMSCSPVKAGLRRSSREEARMVHRTEHFGMSGTLKSEEPLLKLPQPRFDCLRIHLWVARHPDLDAARSAEKILCRLGRACPTGVRARRRRMEWAAGTSWADWLRTFCPPPWVMSPCGTPSPNYGADDATLDRLAWLGLFDADAGPAVLKAPRHRCCNRCEEVEVATR